MAICILGYMAAFARSLVNNHACKFIDTAVMPVGTYFWRRQPQLGHASNDLAVAVELFVIMGYAIDRSAPKTVAFSCMQRFSERM